jgi:hypothetical protein
MVSHPNNMSFIVIFLHYQDAAAFRGAATSRALQERSRESRK